MKITKSWINDHQSSFHENVVVLFRLYSDPRSVIYSTVWALLSTLYKAKPGCPKQKWQKVSFILCVNVCADRVTSIS